MSVDNILILSLNFSGFVCPSILGTAFLDTSFKIFIKIL
jgi:hypothetical protein